jgi:peptidyl-prolyl cis-trans isomerase SurA
MKLLNIFLAFLVLNIISAPVIAQDKKSTVLTVDGEATSLEEFENIFKKNNRDSAVTDEALDDYMELFINFKLKVKEAREMGMDTVSKFRTELDGYRGQLARPYLTDGDMLNGLIREAYDRQCQEVHAYHILVKCEAAATSEDTLRAYNRALALRDRVVAGEDFSTVAKAKDGSDDPSAKDNGGDLGYFTVFQMVYPFEDAAYKTRVGDISMPVRTKYGYHILKVVDKRPARGEIHVEHIMVKAKSEANGEANAETKIREIHTKILNGENFEELAAKFSEDGSSAKKGGELPAFGAGKMVTEFEDASFALKSDGEISKPFKTSYGWHIVKRIGYKPIPKYEEVEKELKSKVSRDARAEKTKASFVTKLKKDYNYMYYDASVLPLIAKADTNIFKGQIKVKKSKLKKTLFEIDGQKHSVKEFTDFIKKRGEYPTKQTPQEFVRLQAAKFAEDKLMEFENSKLEEKHDAFRLLMKEYKEGILLFELTDQKVWSKAVKDSIGLEDYYNKNKAKFMWPDRVNVVIYTCADETRAARVRQMLAEGNDKTEIAAELNYNSQLNLQVEEGVFAKEDKDILANVPWKKGLSDNINQNGQIVIVEVREVIPASIKKLEEARGMITSEYQTYLEQQWITQLRARHKYEVNKAVLHSIH